MDLAPPHGTNFPQCILCLNLWCHIFSTSSGFNSLNNSQNASPAKYFTRDIFGYCTAKLVVYVVWLLEVSRLNTGAFPGGLPAL